MIARCIAPGKVRNKVPSPERAPHLRLLRSVGAEHFAARSQAVGLGFHITHLRCFSGLKAITKGINMLYSYIRTGAIAFVLIAASTTIGLLSKTASTSTQNNQTHFKLDFGPGKVAPGYTQVLPAMTYTKERGYGFEPGGAVAGANGVVTGDKPFFFSVALPEGNYNVTVAFGGAKQATRATVKAELRRLMLEKVESAPGKFESRTFTVNVRAPQIAGGGEVKLKDREKTIETWAWDEKLTLEFDGESPAVSVIEITPAEVPTIFLLGDSTVCDQPLEPYSSWGQMLPRFFGPGVAVANHAESGESLRSSLGARRLDKVLSLIKPGDYLFIQYGHNDQKEKGEGVGAFTTYKTDLKTFVGEARKRGATPVLVTSVNRRNFNDRGEVYSTLGDYPEALRQVAREEKVALIDLNAMSKAFYEALGPQRSALAFKEGDGTHHNNYGAYELARCVVEGIKANNLGVAKFLAKDATAFDPGRPDPPENFKIPASPMLSEVKPPGN